VPKEIDRILAERKTPMPAKIASQAKIPTEYISEEAPRFTLADVSRLTRVTPPETAAENAYRTFTLGSTTWSISHRRCETCQSPELGLEAQQGWH
jgi:hypothetical protein